MKPKLIKLPDAVETRAVDVLVPYARNARTHSDAQVAQIAASIVEFGWTNPVLISGDNTIIAGHGRVLAARKLGMVEVPCIVLDHLTETQRRALIIADNKLALNAGWDDDMLAVEVQSLKDDGFELPTLGLSSEDVARLIGEALPTNAADMRDMTTEPAASKLVFTLTPDQREAVDAALSLAASDDKNEAIVEICHAFRA